MIRLWHGFWHVFPELLLVALLAGQVAIWRELRDVETRIGKRLETLDPPADVVASEIEELRSRLAALERKAAAAQRSRGKSAK